MIPQCNRMLKYNKYVTLPTIYQQKLILIKGMNSESNGRNFCRDTAFHFHH
jgi:hypothetical protein